MTHLNDYSFRPVTTDDRQLLRAWRKMPHVQAWWGTDPAENDKEEPDLRVSRWLVTFRDRPFAFMQDYTVHGWDTHHFSHLPEGARGIDQYIGDPELLGQGHGPAFIAARMRVLFDAGAPVIATDPHPENAYAISAYRKVGFDVAGPPQETQWGLILPMLAAP